MLKILTQVLKADGTTVAQDAIVTCLPQPYQGDQALITFAFFQSQALKDEGYQSFPAIKTAQDKELIYDTVVTLEDGAYSNAIIETKAKEYLETIYGAGNVIII